MYNTQKHLVALAVSAALASTPGIALAEDAVNPNVGTDGNQVQATALSEETNATEEAAETIAYEEPSEVPAADVAPTDTVAIAEPVASTTSTVSSPVADDEQPVSTNTTGPADETPAEEEPASTSNEPTVTATNNAPTADANETADDPTVMVDSPAPSATDTNETPTTTTQDTDAQAVQYNRLYRLYNANSGEHFYTAALSEAKNLATIGWRWEGVGWVAPSTSSTPVYRLYNANAGDHHYTTSKAESAILAGLGWRLEGIGWYSDDPTGVAIFRDYNPNAVAGAHNFTASSAEHSNLLKAGWRAEGIGWYGSTQTPTDAFEGFWLVTSAWGSRQRYWVDANATIAKGRLVDPESNADDAAAGYYAWAKADGSVARGKYVDPSTGYVYLADNDGKLESTGWQTTSAYDNGTTHRYYIDPDAHAAIPGVLTLDSSEYYVNPKVGYVLLSGVASDATGTRYLAAADGTLAPMLTATVSTSNGTKATIRSSVYNKAVYLFLPSFSGYRLTGLSGSSYSGSPVTVYVVGSGSPIKVDAATTLDLAGLGIAPSNGTIELVLHRGEDGPTYALRAMASSSVSTVSLTSTDANKGRAYVEASKNHTAKANVEVLVVDANGTVVYDKDNVAKNKTSTIKGRGNSTWSFGNKKPYQINLNKKSDLLQTGSKDNANKKWILLANANDPTLLHNTLGLNLGLELGLDGTEGTPVDLYYDGEYRGSYYLCEKVEIKSGRVNITSLEDAIEDANDGVDLDSLPTAQATNKYGYTYQYVEGVADPKDITGGYLVEKDNAYYAKETCWFKTSYGSFVVKSPEVASKNCIAYISEYFQKALDNLDAGVFDKEASFDLDSLAKTYLVNEFLKNIDAFTSSTYFTKDTGDVPIYTQPLWDFDGSMGTRNERGITIRHLVYEGFTNSSSYVEHGMAKSPAVQARVRTLYKNTLSPLMHNVVLADDATSTNGYLSSLDSWRDQIATSQRMNEVVFGLTSFRNTIKPFSTYELNYRYLKDWLTWRTTWWDANYTHLSGTVNNPTTVYNGTDYGLVYDYYYYLAKNPDVAKATGGNPTLTLQHFVQYGMKEGRQSSLNFKVGTYRSSYADLRAAYGSDLAAYYRHYMTYGFYEGRLL